MILFSRLSLSREVISASTLTFQRWQVIKTLSPACIDLTWNYANFRSESALPEKPLNILRVSKRNISARNYDNLKFWRKKRKISYWNYQLEILFPEEHPSLPGKTGLHDNLVATDHYYHCIAIYLHMFCFSECRKLFQVPCYSFHIVWYLILKENTWSRSFLLIDENPSKRAFFWALLRKTL